MIPDVFRGDESLRASDLVEGSGPALACLHLFRVALVPLTFEFRKGTSEVEPHGSRADSRSH